MELDRARDLALDLIEQHGLDWKFGWDHARRRAGQTDFTNRRITLSKHLTPLCSPEQVRQTVLHEIAHALVGPGHGHGPVWQAKAKEVGADPRRTTGADFPTLAAPWRAVCSAGHTHERFRLPRRDVSCGYCSRTYSDRHVLSWERAER